MDAEYCQCLRAYPIAENREILIVYLHVETTENDNGETECRVGRYDNSNKWPELWKLGKIGEKDAILFFPRAEMDEMTPRLMSAYNTMNLDVLRAICTSDVRLENLLGGCNKQDDFYSSLAVTRMNQGKMKSAFIRYNDVVYSEVPYIEDYCYFSFSVTSNTDKIDSISEYPLDDNYQDLIVTEITPENEAMNEYPLLSEIRFTSIPDISRFSAYLTFDNGETRQYCFATERTDEDATSEVGSEDIVKIENVAFTDSVFTNGKIIDHIDMPGGIIGGYPQRGQGVSFLNGYSISTAELYFNSFPVGTFNYAQYDDKLRLTLLENEDCGYCIARFSDLNPLNPLYLLNTNTKIATELPEKYQQTPLCIIPFCGGYSEGRIMVSLMGEIDLQYHHNRMPCAGMWGWLDNELNEIITPQYIYAMNFLNGQAIVCKGVWDVIEEDGISRYWCDNEKWGVINLDGEELVPCMFDELYEVKGTDSLFFVHEDGWDEGHFAIFDKSLQKVILELDFDFDIGYMFNECFVTDEDRLVLVDHLPGEGKALIYVYDLVSKKYSKRQM